MLDDRICQNPNCPNPLFHPRRRWQKYCSADCRNAAFWARKFEAGTIESLDRYLDNKGPTEAQEAEWASRSKPKGDDNEHMKSKILAELAEKRLQDRENPEPSGLEKLGYGPKKG